MREVSESLDGSIFARRNAFISLTLIGGISKIAVMDKIK